MFRLPPLERAVADFVREVCEPASSRSKKAAPVEATLKRLTEVIEHLQYVVTEGCFDELREMVKFAHMYRRYNSPRKVFEPSYIRYSLLRCFPSSLLTLLPVPELYVGRLHDLMLLSCVLSRRSRR